MYINYKDWTVMVSDMRTLFSGGITHVTNEEDIILCECTYEDWNFYRVHKETNVAIQEQIEDLLAADRNDNFIEDMKKLQEKLLIKTKTLIVSESF